MYIVNQDDTIGALPNTPLMESAPLQIGDLSHRAHDTERKKQRNKMACLGVLILGGIIALALIIVGIKEATNQPNYLHLANKGGPLESTENDSDKTEISPDSEGESMAPIKVDESNLDIHDQDHILPVDVSIAVDPNKGGPLESTENDSDKTEISSDSEEESTAPIKVDESNLDIHDNDHILPVDVSMDVNPNKEPDTSNENMIDDSHSMLENISSIEQLAIDPVEAVKEDDELLDKDNPLETAVVPTFDIIKDELDKIDPGHKSDFESIHEELGQLEQKILDEDDDGPSARALVFCSANLERRCADKSQCYPVNKRCDQEVDCNDYSDESNCSCVERLIDARYCDGYEDCRHGEDELECKCKSDEFFCDMETWDNPVCKDKKYVCDGVEDCRNGRDEDGCILNFPHTLNLTEARPAYSHKTGLLTVRLGEEYKYLAVDEDLHEDLIPDLAKRTCYGLIDMVEVDFHVIEYNFQPDEVAIIDSYDAKNKRFTFGENDGRYKHMHMVHVQCITKACSAFSKVEKRAHELPEEYLNMSADVIEQAFLNGSLKIEGTEGKIVGGMESNIKLWPSTVALYRNTKFICGGTLISPSWILTAGHCLYKYERGDKFFRIRIGMQRKRSQSPWEQNRIVTEVYMHPDYEPNFLRHDLALGKLDKPVLMNRLAQPMCLPYNDEMTPAPGQTCTAAGWGLVSEKGVASEELKEVKLHVLDDCWRKYNNISYQICAGAELGQDSCQGDSGGPLYCQSYNDENYLAGVISHGKGCGREGEPGVYVRLSKYYQWIEQIMAGAVDKIGDPLKVCPGLMCSTGECVPTSEICDDNVNCLDNGDVRYCQEVNGERVQVLPEGVQLYDEPDLGDVDEVLYDEDDSEGHTHDHDHGHGHGHGHGTETADDHKENNQFMALISDWPKFTRSDVTCKSGQIKCSEVDQCIPAYNKCDGVFNCPDKSDEAGCTCGDKLKQMNSSLVNNGNPDCLDGSDEDQNFCKPNEFICPGTNTCLSIMQKCDKRRDCPGGEDEVDCAVLVNDKQVLLSNTGEVIKNNTGYLILFSGGSWKPICVPLFYNELTRSLCNFMGFSGGTFQLVQKDQSPLNSVVNTTRSNCIYHVYLSCEQPRCGDPVVLRQGGTDTTEVLGGNGIHPWTVSLLADGEYVCSASLIHPKYLLTTWDCGISVLKRKGFNTVVGGQETLDTVGWSPHFQVRRLGKFKSILKTKVLVANLESPFEITNYLRHLCQGPTDFKPQGACHISGKTGNNMMDGYPVELADECSSKEQLCTCDNSDAVSGKCKLGLKKENKNVTTWGGALACPDTTGTYSYVGLNTENESLQPEQFYNLTTKAMFEKIPGLLQEFEKENYEFNKDTCIHRCRRGNCLTQEQICDGKWNCADGSDEKNCSIEMAFSKCKQFNDTLCACPLLHGKCDNNICIPESKFCDGVNDCGDNSDEKPQCDSCLAKLKFTNPSKVCDDFYDCEDGKDEDPTFCGCPEDYFLCKDLSNDENDFPYCQPIQNLCDGRKHCYSGIDEEHSMCINLGSKSVLNSSSLLPVKSSFGDLQIRIKGKWYIYCTTGWEDRMGTALCKELNYGSMYFSTPKDPDMPENVADIGYLESKEKSEPCKTVYIVCNSLEAREAK